MRKEIESSNQIDNEKIPSMRFSKWLIKSNTTQDRINNWLTNGFPEKLRLTEKERLALEVQLKYPEKTIRELSLIYSTYPEGSTKTFPMHIKNAGRRLNIFFIYNHESDSISQ